jgi:hypothetical protein
MSMRKKLNDRGRRKQMQQQADGWMDPESLQLAGQPLDVLHGDLPPGLVSMRSVGVLREEEAMAWSRALPAIATPTGQPGDLPAEMTVRQDEIRQGLRAVSGVVPGIVPGTAFGPIPGPAFGPVLDPVCGPAISLRSSGEQRTATAAAGGSHAERRIHPSRNLGWDLGWENLNVPGRVRWLETVVDRGSEGRLAADLSSVGRSDEKTASVESLASLLHEDGPAGPATAGTSNTGTSKNGPAAARAGEGAGRQLRPGSSLP